MTPLLVYLSKVVICSGILYAYYYAVLRNNRFHQWNRYYLLLSTMLSLVVPLLRIPLPFTQADTADTIYVYTSQVVTLREQVLAPSPLTAVASINWTTWLYAAVLLALLARITTGYWKILRLIRSSRVEFLKPYWLVLSEKIASPFSFFRYIFWNSGFSAETTEGRQILRHEMVHIQERHSSDKLFMEVITALCWINPFFHLIKRELAMIHEFIADRKAVVNGDVAEYAQSILQMALQSNHAFNIANSFSHQPIKRRILMLTQSRNLRFSYLRRVCILPLAAFIFCSLAFVADEKQISFNDSSDAPAAAPDTRRNVQQTTPGATAAATVPTKAAGMPSSNHPAATVPPSDTVAVRSGADTIQPGQAKRPAPPPPAPGQETGQDLPNPIFTFVEHPPQFPGGEEELAKYLSRNIRYPQAAMEKEITGTVFVTFIVRNDGTIQNVKTVGAKKGGGLEEEGIRVVQGMPKWKPGRQNGRDVSVQFNLPIRFSLSPTPKPDNKPKVSDNGVYRQADKMPAFPGGEGALAQYLSANLRYPKTAIDGKKQGTVLVSFIVKEDGSLNDIAATGKTIGSGLEEEAVRVVKKMPKWTPAKDGDKDVPVEVQLPIAFRLQ